MTFNYFRLLDPSKGREPKGIDVHKYWSLCPPRHDYVTIRHPFLSITKWSPKPRRGRKAISVRDDDYNNDDDLYGFAALLWTLPSRSTRVEPLSPARVLTHKSKKTSPAASKAVQKVSADKG